MFGQEQYVGGWVDSELYCIALHYLCSGFQCGSLGADEDILEVELHFGFNARHRVDTDVVYSTSTGV